MPKSPDAFRTISEVAEWLGIQAHVLRFWESKFTQVKPIKRAGGRRYYRPSDMMLLGGIKKLLHEDGLTIKGVQKILREEGMSHVVSLSMPLDDSELDTVAAAPMMQVPEPEPQSVVLPFEPTRATEDDDASQATPAPEPDAGPEAQAAPPTQESAAPDTAETGARAEPEVVEKSTSADTPATTTANETSEASPESETGAETGAEAARPAAEDATASDVASDPEPDEPDSPPAPEPAETAMEPLPGFLREPATEDVAHDREQAPKAQEHAAEAPEPPERAAEADPDPQPQQDSTPTETLVPAGAAAPAPRARDIGMPQVQAENEVHAEPGSLTRAFRTRALSPGRVQKVTPLLAQLTALRDKMATPRSANQTKS